MPPLRALLEPDEQVLDGSGVPKGIRTPVTAVKGRCPRPLDEGDKIFVYRRTATIKFCKAKDTLVSERPYPRTFC